MKTIKAKQNPVNHKGDFRRIMALTSLYKACLKNAEELLKEAKLLFDHGYFARAYALAYTGWEEVGKSQITADFASGMVSEDEFENAYKDHKIKSAYNWRKFVFDMKKPDDSKIEYDRAKANTYFEARQAALYVNKTQEYKELIPSQIVNKNSAESAINALEHELQEIFSAEMISERIGSNAFLK